jgi:hypothetical protein
LTLLVNVAWIIGECGVDNRHSQFARPKRWAILELHRCNRINIDVI